MLNEYVYCPRLAYLEWVQGEFAHSTDTAEGAIKHRRVDKARGNLPEAPEPGEKVHFSCESGLSFDFWGRNRRPPKDPINATLSLGYAMPVRQCTVTLSLWA